MQQQAVQQQPDDSCVDAVFQLDEFAPVGYTGPRMPLPEDGLQWLGDGYEVLEFPWVRGAELSEELQYGLHLAGEDSF
jgi:hypothetical protein